MTAGNVVGIIRPFPPRIALQKAADSIKLPALTRSVFIHKQRGHYAKLE
jgi:hypothetical protein